MHYISSQRDLTFKDYKLIKMDKTKNKINFVGKVIRYLPIFFVFKEIFSFPIIFVFITNILNILHGKHRFWFDLFEEN